MRFTILLTFITLLASGLLQAQTPTNGLIGAWLFSGNANDETANSNNGITHGVTLTTDRFGVENNAYNFDGVDDYIDLGNGSVLNRYNTNFTFSAWIRRSSTPSGYTQPIFTNRVNNEGSEIYISGQLNGYPGHLGYVTYDGNNYGIARTNDPVAINNQYEHIVVVYNYIGGDNNTVRLYVNNLLESTTTGVIDAGTSTSSTYIGWMPTYAINRHFEGDIDDVFVYDRALDSAGVDSLYNANFVGISKNEKPDLMIYPNPAFEEIVIDAKGSKINEVTLLSLSGKVVKRITKTTNIISIADLPSGVYIVRMITDENIISRRIIKK